MCMCVYVYDLRWIINNEYNYIFILFMNIIILLMILAYVDTGYQS